MTNLTPQAEEVLIKRLVSLNLNDTQFNSLARSIGVAPLDIFSSQFTNLQKAEALVTKANQLGIHYNLENEIDNNLFKTYNSKSVSTLFDNHLAYDFGLLYRDLLHSLETTQDTQTYDNKFFHHLEFKAKLKFKAKFKPSTRKTAIIYKNDNSVLQRKVRISFLS